MKTALITGCNRGLGRGILDELLGNGFTVYGLNKTKLEEELPNYFDINCDISNMENIKSIENVIPKQIDLIVLNAGIRRFNEIDKIEIKDWNDSVNTNLNGVFYVLNRFIANVKKAKGDVVIIGSHSEKYTFGKGAAYCSTKLAIRGISECLMDEVRYDDVRVSYLSLGSIKNREHNIEEGWKLTPKEVGQTVISLVNLPKKVLIPYLDVRPIKPLKDIKEGIEKLQYV